MLSVAFSYCYVKCRYDDCHYAKCRYEIVIILNVVILSVVAPLASYLLNKPETTFQVHTP
jgi:hypothetical protein